MHTMLLQMTYDGGDGAIPASLSASHPEHTEAIEEEPLLSVMVLSTRTTYGKSSCDSRALERR